MHENNNLHHIWGIHRAIRGCTSRGGTEFHSGQPPVLAWRTAQSAASSQSAKQTPAPSDGTHGDVYYYFTMGHVDEMQFELTGQPDLATQSIESYKKALELAPGSSVIMERLAEIYAKSQHIRDAVEQAQAALQADPNNVEAHRLLARIYVRTLGDLSAGDGQKENLDKAIEQFQAILKIQPDDAYSELWLARLYRFENQHSDAEKVLRDLLQRDPGNGPALEQLSQLLMDEGRSQEAVKILSDAANDSSSPEVYDLLGDAYSQAKEYAKAEDAYRKAVEEDPDDPGPFARLGASADGAGQVRGGAGAVQAACGSGTWHRRELLADGAVLPAPGKIRSGGIEFVAREATGSRKPGSAL